MTSSDSSPQPNVLPVTEAARAKNCTPQAIYNAIDRGDLNGLRMGNHRLVVRDDTYQSFEIKETGGRCHESYRKRERQVSSSC